MYKNINGQNLSTKERKALTKECAEYGFDPQYFTIAHIEGCENNGRLVTYSEPNGDTIKVGYMISVHEGEWLNVIQLDAENRRTRIATIPMPDNPADWQASIAKFVVVCDECGKGDNPVFKGICNDMMLYDRVPGLFAINAQYAEWQDMQSIH